MAKEKPPQPPKKRTVNKPQDTKKGLAGAAEIPQPFHLAVDRMSLSVVNEATLTMVAMHGILSSGAVAPAGGVIRQMHPDSLAEAANLYAKAVMAELMKK